MDIVSTLQSLVNNVAPFFILLGLLIFVHELGHFLVAKFFGVRVEVFSLGFGKKLFSFKRGDTNYCLSMIPLGGYVKMYGDDPSAEIPENERQYAFLKKPLWPRIAIVLAGPLMNLVFAFALFMVIGKLGTEMAGPFVGDLAENSKAFAAGFRAGDKILKIGSTATATWSDVTSSLEGTAGRAISVLVERKGESQPLSFDVAVSLGENENIFSSNRQTGQIPGLTPDSRSTLIGVRNPDSPAAKAGLSSLDQIVSVDDTPIQYWRDLQPLLYDKLSPSGSKVTLEVRTLAAGNATTVPTRKVTVEVPSGWDEKTDLADWLGVEPAELYIFQVKDKSPAARAGIETKDRVVRINNEDVQSWNDVLTHVKGYDATTDGLDFTVIRNGQEKTIRLKPEMTELMSVKGQEEKRFTVGIVSGFFPADPQTVIYRVAGLGDIITFGARQTVKWTEFIVMSMVRLIQGDVSAKNIGGVITIGRVASHSFAAGISTFLHTMAIISINLFLLNLLPIPVLDGGHLLFYTIEGLRGAPLSMRKMELAQQVGLMLLMLLMAFAFFNDISNLFSSRW